MSALDRDMLMAVLVGRVMGICRGFSLPSDANEAMCQICDALTEYQRNRAASFEAEDGPFASTFAIYAIEARELVDAIKAARERWEVSNVYLLGRLDAALGKARSTRFLQGSPATAEQAAGND